MLYYEDGCICNTSTGTKQAVSKEELTRYLSLGLEIKGVDGNDWRYANRIKLKALSDVEITIASNECLVTLTTSTPVVINLSDIAKGLCNYLYIFGACTIILDDTLNYDYFVYLPISTGAIFDLRGLNVANTAIICLSLVSTKAVLTLSQGHFTGFSHLKVHSDSRYSLALLCMLAKLDAVSGYDRDLVIHNIKSNYEEYKEGVVPYLDKFISILNSVDIRGILPDLEGLNSLLRGLIDSGSVLERLDLIMSRFCLTDGCKVYLQVFRSYIIIFGVLPKGIRHKLNSFIINFITVCEEYKAE